jgi:hypothetical protein
MLLGDVLGLSRMAVAGSPIERQRGMQMVASRLGTIREMLSLPLDFDPSRHVPALDAAGKGAATQG